MVTITAQSHSNLSCQATHEPSGVILKTDAPADVGGHASSFSPTDLVGTALLTCIMTTMGLVATRRQIDLTGMHGTVTKTMSSEKPRRINKLKIDLHVPVKSDHPEISALENAAHNCPVNHSLHPETHVELILNYLF